MTIAFLKNQPQYNKPILFLFCLVASLTLSVPWLIHDVIAIVFLQSSFLAILIGGLGIIVARSFSDKTDTEIRKIETKIDSINEKLNATPPQVTIQPPPAIDLAQLQYIIEEWKVVIQTQMHFNDLIMKVRTATLSVVLAVFGAAGYSFSTDEVSPLTINDMTFHPSALIVGSGIFILVAVFVVDYGYYYKMLIGAVTRGYQFDKEFQELQAKFGRRYFGMSSTIRDSIGKTGRSKYFVMSFYLIPIGGGFVFLLLVLIGYQVPSV